MIAYLVVEVDSGNTYQTKRVYLDRAEADAHVVAYNAMGGEREVEEIVVGAPDVEHDGPVWVGTWTTRRKRVGEKQLLIVTNGFVTVVPSAAPTTLGGYVYQEMFDGPGWWELAAPIEYEEPPVWIDDFHYHQEWYTGDAPGGPSGQPTVYPSVNRVEVRGASKDAVEQALRDIARRVRAERDGEPA